MKRIKFKDVIAIACAAFMVICNLKYAHDGYGIRNAKPEERGYATTAKPTYRHEKYPYHIMCDAVVVYVYVKWSINPMPGRPHERDSVSDAYAVSGLSIKEAFANARMKETECKDIDPKCSVKIDNFYSIQPRQYPSCELRCEPSGTMIDCQNETGDECPMLEIS